MKEFDLGVVMYRAIVHKAAQNVTDYDTKNLTQILCWRWIKIALTYVLVYRNNSVSLMLFKKVIGKRSKISGRRGNIDAIV